MRLPNLQSRKSRFLWTVLSLACGVVIGVALSVTTAVEPFAIDAYHGEKMLFPLHSIIATGVFIASEFGIAIALLSVLPWRLLRPIGYQTLANAALLGFSMTFAVWILSCLWDDRFIVRLSRIEEAATYGLAGAVAGIVTFWVSRPLRTSAI